MKTENCPVIYELMHLSLQMSACGENYGQNVGRTCEHAANNGQDVCLQKILPVSGRLWVQDVA
jgi:hypothetical protein